MTPAELRWGARTERWRRVDRGVYAVGPEPLTRLDRRWRRSSPHRRVARSRGRRSRRIGSSSRSPARAHHICVRNPRCTDGLQTVVDLAALLDDLTWEHAAESAFHKKLTSVASWSRHCRRWRGHGHRAPAGFAVYRPAPVRCSGHGEPAGDADGAARPYRGRARRPRPSIRVVRRVRPAGRPSRPGVAGPGPVRRARWRASQGQPVYDSSRDSRGGAHRVAVRPLQLVGGPPWPHHHRSTIGPGRRAVPPPAADAVVVV